MATLCIGSPVITQVGEVTRWSVPTEAPGLPGTLWFQVPRHHEDMLSDRADPALVALILAAMHRGFSIAVEGVVTDELAATLAGPYQALARVTNGVPTVAIRCEHQAPPAPRAAGVATGYSAGIDSFACLADHYFLTNAPPSQQLTHLLFNNVGSHAPGQQGRDIWRAKAGPMHATAERFGLPLLPIDSNLDDFYYNQAGFVRPVTRHTVFEQTHTPRNASVAHLLSASIRWPGWAGLMANASVTRKNRAYQGPVLHVNGSTRNESLPHD